MAANSVATEMTDKSILVVGNLNIDLVFYPVNTLPSWGEEKTCKIMLIRSAGSAGYSALALGRFGLQTTLIGNIGNDIYGTMIMKDLKEVQVNINEVYVSNCPTGVSVTIVNETGERAFVTYYGHLEAFSTDSAIRGIDSISHVDYCLLSGYFLLPGLGANGAIEILRACHKRGGVTLLDTGCDPKGWQADTIRDVHRILREVDIFLPNMEEAIAISGKSDAKEAAKTIIDLGPTTVIIKQGKWGSTHVSRSSSPITAPAIQTRVFDTTGAGDAFNAGVIYSLLKGWDPQDLLRFANTTSSIVISRKEERFPTVNEVIKALERT